MNKQLKSFLFIFNQSCRNTSFREITQFAPPIRCDCDEVPIKVPRDPTKCTVKDKGLVLGVYYNDKIHRNRTILTASAEKYNVQTEGRLWNLLKMSPTPKLGECRVFYDIDPIYAFVAVAGLGSECLDYNDLENMDESKEAIRVAAGTGARALQQLEPKFIHVESFGHAESAAEGAALSMWLFQEYKNFQHHLSQPELTLYDDCDLDGWNLGKQKSEAQNLARHLQEMPANYLNPTMFAKTAVGLLAEVGINVKVKVQGWAESQEMGGFVAIGKSSCQPPLFLEITYYGGKHTDRPVVLIGKGVTFDSGGLNLKTAKELKYMKGDMAGAACVAAVTRAAALLKLPVNIRGLIPLCELMPNCNSAKRGDIVTSSNGKHIKVHSSEGRMIIADSLVYARNYWPKFIIDIGTMCEETLTTLGPTASACYSNSEELFRFLQKASSHTGDRIWRMPLWKYYNEKLQRCEMSDLVCSTEAAADSPQCAAFLNQFVCDAKWLHLDTYGVMFSHGKDFPYLRAGMTGRPTRTIIELLYQLLEHNKL